MKILKTILTRQDIVMVVKLKILKKILKKSSPGRTKSWW